MTIKIESTDGRAVDHFVRKIVNTATNHSSVNVIAIPVSTKVGVESKIRRMVKIINPTKEIMDKFDKMTMPSNVNILITK